MISQLRKSWQKLRANRWRALLVDVLLILVFFQAVAALQKRDMLTGNRQTTPALALPDLDGNWVEMQPQQSKRTLVYFFAPWCTVCKHSVPHLNRLRELRSQDELSIYVVGLSWENVDELRQFVLQTQLQLPVLIGVHETALDWKIRAFPTYYVLDQQGKVISSDLGLSTEWGLRWRTWAWPEG